MLEEAAAYHQDHKSDLDAEVLSEVGTTRMLFLSDKRLGEEVELHLCCRIQNDRVALLFFCNFSNVAGFAHPQIVVCPF